MPKELEIWQFISARLKTDRPVALLVVAESSGSSPGRRGFKMAVSAGEMCGSIGGGVMEVNLVNRAREILRNYASESEPPAVAGGLTRSEIPSYFQRAFTAI